MAGEPTLHDIPVVAESAPQLRLVVHSGANPGMRIPCRRVVTLLGSRRGCKVNLQHASIGPVHLALVNDGTHIIAADLATRKGTKINGLKVDQDKLNHGDLIEVASWELRVEIRQPQRFTNDDAVPVELDQSPEAVALEHLDSGRVLAPSREICMLGRRTGCDIHIDNDRVSRAHAILLRHYGFPAVFDLLSKTGTFVNDQRVSYRRLQDEDVLRIGDAAFRVRLIGSSVGKSKPRTESKPRQPEQQQPPSQSGLIELEPADDEEEEGDDLIDIESVEGTQHWRVADQLDSLARKS